MDWICSEGILKQGRPLWDLWGLPGGGTIHQEANLLSMDFQVPMNFLNIYANVHFLGKELSDFLRFS